MKNYLTLLSLLVFLFVFAGSVPPNLAEDQVNEKISNVDLDFSAVEVLAIFDYTIKKDLVTYIQTQRSCSELAIFNKLKTDKEFRQFDPYIYRNLSLFYTLNYKWYSSKSHYDLT